ncbi:MAG: EAL domain-containing protein [Zoogloeaceae bacterium]|nr:EAL domain-containing protein [Zoogloeaceae bacterium]
MFQLDPADAAPPWAHFEHLPLGLQAGCRLRRSRDGRAVADWFGCELASAFQPIVEPISRQVMGWEAFLRVQGSRDRQLSPWRLFSSAADDYRLMGLDRLCRTLHLLNALQVGAPPRLFLNVHGRLLAAVTDDHGKAFRRVVDTLAVDPRGLVIETPLAASEQLDLLEFVLGNYRRHGFQVAVNVDSVAQWERLVRVIQPDFVKLDSRLLGHPAFGPGLADLLARRGPPQVILTHQEGPGSPGTHGATWRQGYAYGYPATMPPRGREIAPHR